ncbi:hypothetical protein [Phaeacidiphilus oryzae]|uniref:hypothetical protein n=1 Tax=Phaeacidiphilus oryzae TaxID=348818 RepID=UPI0005644E4D|nr:hypothetical protein [Phaeacidiphilus oryzae]
MPRAYPPMPQPGPAEQRPAPPAGPRQIGIATDGQPIWDQNDRTPVVIHHHYAPKARLDPRDVFAWVMVAGAVSAVLIAVSFAAVALAIAAVAIAISVLVLYGLYRQMKTEKKRH